MKHFLSHTLILLLLSPEALANKTRRLYLEVSDANTEAADSALLLIDCLFREGEVETDVFSEAKKRFPMLTMQTGKHGLAASLRWRETDKSLDLGIYPPGDSLKKLCTATVEQLETGAPTIDLTPNPIADGAASVEPAPIVEKKSFLTRNWIYIGLGAVVLGGAAVLIGSRKSSPTEERSEARGFVIR